jgi:hypothetical protein
VSFPEPGLNQVGLLLGWAQGTAKPSIQPAKNAVMKFSRQKWKKNRRKTEEKPATHR